MQTIAVFGKKRAHRNWIIDVQAMSKDLSSLPPDMKYITDLWLTTHLYFKVISNFIRFSIIFSTVDCILYQM